MYIKDIESKSGDTWSVEAADFFRSLVKQDKQFRTTLIAYQVESDKFVIDLHDNKVSISKLLLASGHAKSI